MNSKFAGLLILVGAVASYGCAVVVIGAGAGAGAAAYLKGKVTRTYDAGYRRTVRASVEALDALKLRVSEETGDEAKTVIRAERADGTPVSVEVVPVGPGQTEVGVRTGTVGISELEASEQIQASIRKRLSPLPLGAFPSSDRPASITPPEPVEESPRAVIAPKTALGRQGPTSTQTGSKRHAPELTIYFDRDSNELLQNEIVKLDHIAETSVKKPNSKLILNGYSDSSGSMDYNRMISESRASAVKMYLAGKGVDPSRMTVVGHGAKNFAAGNTSEEGRQFNRRVEITFVGD